MAIFVLALWLATAVAGATLLRAGGSARRAQAGPVTAEQVLAESMLADQFLAQPLMADPLVAQPLVTQPLVAQPAHTGAVPLTPAGLPPPGPHVRVTTPAGEHPLLEFSHPALAVTGIACWLMFTFIHYRPLAWIAFGVLLATLLLGLGWLARNRQASRRHAAAAWPFPPRLVLAHGLIAGLSILLTVLTALIASRA